MARTIAALFLASILLSSLASAQPGDEENRRQALVRYHAGQQLMRAEHWDEAAEEFTAAIKLDPLLTLAHYDLGQTYMAVKRYASAIVAYQGCLEAFRQLASLQWSDMRQADQRRDEEIRELRDSIRLIQSGTIKTMSPANDILKIEARIRSLEVTKQRSQQDFQPPAEVSMALGSAYFRNGALEDAEREYRTALKANSKFGEAHNNLAVVLMMTDRFDEAEKEVKEAERSGFRVNPQFKTDLRAKKSGALP